MMNDGPPDGDAGILELTPGRLWEGGEVVDRPRGFDAVQVVPQLLAAEILGSPASSANVLSSGRVMPRRL